MTNLPWLSIITFFPIIGGIILSGLGSADRRVIRPLSLAFALLPLALTIVVCCRFDTTSPDLQFVERHQWIPSIGAEYFLGVDGLGLVSLLLTGIVIPLAMLA